MARMGAGARGEDMRAEGMGTLDGFDGGRSGGLEALGVMVNRSVEDPRETLFRRSRGSLGWRGMRV